MGSTYEIPNNKNYTTMTTNNRILATLSTIANGTMVVVEMATEPSWKSVKNPYKGRVIKHTHIANVGLGICYTNAVESHAKRSGVVDKYIPDAPNGMHYPTKVGKDGKVEIATYQYLISDNNPNQLYLNLVYRGNEKKDIYYTLDGVRVEDETLLEDIKSHIRPPYKSKKQSNFGVADKDIIVVNRPKFENIVMIKQGVREYRRQEITKIAM